MQNDYAQHLERLETLEIKSAYQEDTIEKLNAVVIAQEVRLDSCERMMKHLIEKIKELQPEVGVPFDQQEKPPHY